MAEVVAASGSATFLPMKDISRDLYVEVSFTNVIEFSPKAQGTDISPFFRVERLSDLPSHTHTVGSQIPEISALR